MSSSKRYPEEFKIEAVKQVTEKGHSVAEVAARLGTTTHSRPLAKVNLRASNSVFLQLNSFLNQIVFVYSYSVLLISENA